MDTTQVTSQHEVALPTDGVEPSDLHVEVVSMETFNGTKIMNGTSSAPRPGEPVDYMPLLADWSHGKNLPSFKSVFIGLAIAVHIVVDFFLHYFLWEVVYTLAAVEAPQIIVPAPWSDKKSDDDDDEVPQIQQERATTKSLRTTIRHLYSVGGPFAIARGMALHVSINIAMGILMMPIWVFWTLRAFSADDAPTTFVHNPTLSNRLKSVLQDFGFQIVANLVFCSWLAAWVHVVITQHTLRVWYRRLPPFLPTLYATWRPLVVLPVVSILLRHTAVILLRHNLGLYGEHNKDQGVLTSRNMLLTLVWLVAQGIKIFASLPLSLALVRVQASLLPEDEEAIVSFDRSFGTGGVNGLRPGLLAEPRGPLSFREAWRSLTWTEMRRIVKTCAKMLAVQAAVKGVFWLAVGNDVWPDNWVPARVY